MTNELYAEAYSKNYNLTIAGFRYFNVFGPKQDPEGPYAAVIPLFMKAAKSNVPPTINGDGSITRDFTPVVNVVNMNILGLTGNLEGSKHYVFNVACGATTDLLSIWNMIKEITGSTVDPIFGAVRKGDILFSLADVSFAKEVLSYEPDGDLRKALKFLAE
jgi:UDP-N-acetylglucosamine 4-epimerase